MSARRGAGPFEITWDPKKAAANLRKHGVSLVEGASAWFDPLADVDTRGQPAGRYLLIGMSEWRRVLVAVFVEVTDTGAHIISARKATRAQRRRYEEGGGLGNRARVRVVRPRNPFWRRVMRYGIWIHPRPGVVSRSGSALARRVAAQGYILRARVGQVVAREY